MNIQNEKSIQLINYATHCKILLREKNYNIKSTKVSLKKLLSSINIIAHRQFTEKFLTVNRSMKGLTLVTC
jgi:hypothetical protein